MSTSTVYIPDPGDQVRGYLGGSDKDIPVLRLSHELSIQWQTDAEALQSLRDIVKQALDLAGQIEARRAEQNQPPLYPNDGGSVWERHDDPEEQP